MCRFIKIVFALIVSFGIGTNKGIAQSNIDPRVVHADKIDTSNYYGVTVANGIGHPSLLINRKRYACKLMAMHLYF